MAGTQKQREEINRVLVASQMELIGLTYEDAMNTPEFWRVYTLTTEQIELWRRNELKLIKKTFKCNRTKALLILNSFEKNLGLRIEDLPIVDEDISKDVEKHTFLDKIKELFKKHKNIVSKEKQPK